MIEITSKTEEKIVANYDDKYEFRFEKSIHTGLCDISRWELGNSYIKGVRHYVASLPFSHYEDDNEIIKFVESHV